MLSTRLRPLPSMIAVALLCGAFASAADAHPHVWVSVEATVLHDKGAFVGLTYTWIRTPDNDRFVVPNEKLASDTIRNSTIRGRDTFAEVTVQVPAGPGLGKVLESLEGVGDESYVSELGADKATILVRKWVSDERDVERAASDLRVALAERL